MNTIIFIYNFNSTIILYFDFLLLCYIMHKNSRRTTNKTTQSKKTKKSSRTRRTSRTSRTNKKFNLLPKPGTEVHLSSTGYQVHKDDKIRQRALKKASKKYDTLEVLRRLNLIRNLTPKHTNTYKKMSSDVDFMKKYYKHSK